MKALHSAFLLLSASSASLVAADVRIGDQVCMTGFIMDNFCIERGTLLDNRRVTTLQNPELHSYHCLLDLTPCINSGYQVLGNKDPSSGLHCPGLRIDNTNEVLRVGRAHGTSLSRPGFFTCSQCNGPDENPIAGYQATIIGTVATLGDGMGRVTGVPGTRSIQGTPTLTNIQVLDSTIPCDESMLVTVAVDGNNECLIRSTADDDSSSSSPPITTNTDATTAATTTTTTTTPAATTGVENDQDCSSGFCMTTLTDGYTLEYMFNEEEATITMKLTYDGKSWLGIAFSEDERMGGSDGIIGSPDDGIPQKYRLSQGFINIAPPEEQTLTDASIVYDIDGQTVMTFTKPLVEPNQIPITVGENMILWAHGGEGVTTIGYHGQYREFLLINLASSSSSSPPPPMTEDYSSATTTPPAAAVVENDQDCSSGFCQTTLTEGYTLEYMFDEVDGTITMKLTYDGESWLGIAFSEDNRMGGSDGIIGSPDDGIPQNYRLSQGFIDIAPPEEQTLTDASIVYDVDGQTVMTFTKPLVEPNQIPITLGENMILWAHGGDGTTTIGYHGQYRESLAINLASGAAEVVLAPNMGAWLAHGICAFIAWGMLAPTAVNSAIYRSLFNGPLWFKLHQFLNASAYALTVVAFGIAVGFINREGNPHWFSSHAKMGLSMFIIASVQVLWGAIRPHLPESGEEKTTIRKVWEIKHRVTGTVLLACAFWQMYAGIKLYAFKYDGVGSVQEQGVTIAYWIWIGLQVALLLVGGVYFKLQKRPVEEDGGNDGADAAEDKQQEHTA